MLKRTIDRGGIPLGGTQKSLTELATDFKPAGLIVHDREDRIVPYRYAEELSTAWPSARLFGTHKLGHSRILKDEEVIQVIASQMPAWSNDLRHPGVGRDPGGLIRHDPSPHSPGTPQ